MLKDNDFASVLQDTNPYDLYFAVAMQYRVLESLLERPEISVQMKKTIKIEMAVIRRIVYQAAYDNRKNKDDTLQTLS